jgi:hypothetical protein
MFQIVPGICDALSKTFCKAVNSLLIRLCSVWVVKVTPFQSQNFQVFVKNGTFVELFGWLRANVSPGRIPSSAGSTPIAARKEKPALSGCTGNDSYLHVAASNSQLPLALVSVVLDFGFFGHCRLVVRV